MRDVQIRNNGLSNGERERAPIGTKVVQILKLAADRWLVREDYFQFPPGQSNIYCVDEDLDTVWSVELPSSDDSFCNDARLVDGRLRVWTWQCYCCDVDLSSGRIITKLFTK